MKYLIAYGILFSLALITWINLRAGDPYREFENWMVDHGYDPEDGDDQIRAAREYCEKFFCRGVR